MSNWHRPNVETSALNILTGAAKPVAPTSARQIVDGLLARGRAKAQASGTVTDFFQPGTTYTDAKHPEYDWRFRCDTVTTHPDDGERTALGWRHFRGQWEPYAYGEDDWDIQQFIKQYATTRGEPGDGA